MSDGTGGKSLPPGTSPTGVKPDGTKGQVGLRHAVTHWPTPRAEHDSGGHRGTKDTLHSAVKAWPTPRASPNENRQTKPSPSQLAGKHGMSLGVAVNWPTPVAGDAKAVANATAIRSDPNSKHHSGTTLTDATRIWATPIASESRQGFQDRSRGMKGSQESLSTQAMKPQGGAGTAPLNPAWVEQLMGFPDGWTELPPEVLGRLALARRKPRGKRPAPPPTSAPVEPA